MMGTFLENAEALRPGSPVTHPTGIPEVKRPAGDTANYVQEVDLKTWCLSCGGAVMGKRVYRSVWDGPFPCSGSGEVRTEIVPFCPTCEIEPSEHGAPIEEDRYGVKGGASL